jgi:hypothetical protein
MDKNLYTTVARAVKEKLPSVHLHAFSPEEIIYGANRRKCSVLEMISDLKEVYICICIYLHMYIFIHIFVHVYIYDCMYINTYIYMCIYILYMG